MEFLEHLTLGFSVAFSLQNIVWCSIGVAVGTFVGVLPGTGLLTVVTMMLPVTIGMPPVTSLILLAGIYYGVQYGESTAAILLKIPGGPGSVVTCLDGHPMALKGRGGAALTVAAVGSFIGSMLGILFLAVAALPIAGYALSLGPVDYCALMVLILTSAVVLERSSYLKSAAMVFLGIIFATVGLDPMTGTARYTFGIPELYTGLTPIAFVIGLFGISYFMEGVDILTDARGATRVGSPWPTKAEWRSSWPAILRGSGVGIMFGMLPGGGPIPSSFFAYFLERRVGRKPERFGHGAIEGVAGPESANNAAAQASFIPLLALGIPGTPVMAMLLGVLMMNGITPGPTVIAAQPELFWGLVCSMLIGNLLLLVLNLPLIGMWVRLVAIPHWWLVPTVLCVSCIGVYSVNLSTVDLMVLAFSSALGYLCHWGGYKPLPLVMGFFLAPRFEEYLGPALMHARGNAVVFITSPLSLVLLTASVFLIVSTLYFRSKRDPLRIL